MRKKKSKLYKGKKIRPGGTIWHLAAEQMYEVNQNLKVLIDLQRQLLAEQRKGRAA